jgi:hypothetical protein
MRKGFIVFGLIVFLLGAILELASGAILPGGFTLPGIYGSNQILWLFVIAVGLIIAIMGVFMKSKKKLKDNVQK